MPTVKLILVGTMLVGLTCWGLLPSADATTYQWITPDGVVGLTNDPGRIPEQYRERATVYNGTSKPPSREPAAEEGITVPQQTAVTTPAGPSIGEADQHGHDRSWWQQQIREVKDQLTFIGNQRKTADEELNQLYYFGMETPEELQRQQFLREKIGEFDELLAKLERRLTEELPREARKAGALPGWLRD